MIRSLRARLTSRCCSSAAKCAVRRSAKRLRAPATRCHSSSSVFLSTPVTRFQSSPSVRSRSPAVFHSDDPPRPSASSASAVFFADRLLPLLGPGGLGRLDRRGGALEQAVDAPLQPGQVADRGRGRHRRLEALGARGDLLRVAGAAGEALLEQRHLRGELLVPPGEVRQPVLRAAGLPGPDLALAVRGLDEDGAVLGDSTPLAHAAPRSPLSSPVCPPARAACSRARAGAVAGASPRSAGRDALLALRGPGPTDSVIRPARSRSPCPSSPSTRSPPCTAGAPAGRCRRCCAAFDAAGRRHDRAGGGWAVRATAHRARPAAAAGRGRSACARSTAGPPCGARGRPPPSSRGRPGSTWR